MGEAPAHLKQIFVHIGDGKCGSSSIQAALLQKSTSFAARGLTYPVSEGSVGHFELGELVGKRGRRPQAEALRIAHDLQKQALEADRLIISAENFMSVDPDAFFSLVSETEDVCADVIAYVRSPIDQYLSYVQQQLKGSSTFPPPDQYSKSITGSLRRWKLHPYVRSMTVRRFDRSVLLGSDVVEDYSTWLSAKSRAPTLSKAGPERNTSLTAEQTIVLQRVRRTLGKELENQFHPISHALLAFFARLNREAMVGSKLSLSPEARRGLENANRRNIERINAAFPGLDLPAAPQPDGNEIGAAPWDKNADVAAILDRHDATLVAHLEALVPALNDEGVPLTLTSSHADAIAYMANTYDIEPNVVADLAAAYYARSGLKELAVDVKKLHRKGGT